MEVVEPSPREPVDARESNATADVRGIDRTKRGRSVADQVGAARLAADLSQQCRRLAEKLLAVSSSSYP